MAKKITGYIKLQIPAGKANPSPPIGPALGQHGVNIMEFCKAFNAKTQADEGTITPVVITVFADRSFSFITKTPPAAILLKKAAKIEKASGEPNRIKVARVSKDQVREIAQLKMPDLNAASLEAAMSMVAGTARSMGIDVVDFPWWNPQQTRETAAQVIAGRRIATDGLDFDVVAEGDTAEDLEVGALVDAVFV